MKKKKIVKIFKKKEKKFKKQYKKLLKHYNEENIHDFRVSWRRLKSLYKALHISGFQSTNKLEKDVKEIFNILGETRDYQVNLIVLRNLYFVNKVPEEIEKIFIDKIKNNEKKVKKKLVKNKKKIFKKLKKDKKLVKRYLNNVKTKDFEKSLELTSEEFKEKIESKSKNLTSELRSYHKLRLEIKKYRYFLEVYSYFDKNIKKEKIRRFQTFQQLLGDINDLAILEDNISILNVKVEEPIIRALQTRLQNKIREFKMIF